MEYRDRLKTARKYAKLTQAELAERIGVTQVTISDLERGKNASSTFSFDMARLCGVNPEWLINGKGEMIPSIQKINPVGFDANVIENDERLSRFAPVISWVQAGNWKEAQQPYSVESADEWEQVSATDSANTFWLRVTGDSMTSPYGVSVPEGSLIKVDPEKPYFNGSFVVARVVNEATGHYEATFKKLVSDAGRQTLMPLNDRYDKISVSESCEIVGVVTEVRIKLTK